MQMRRILSENEEIRYQTKKHWAVFLKAGIYFALAVVLLWAKDPLQAKAVALIPQEYLKALTDEDIRAYPGHVGKAILGELPAKPAQPPQADLKKSSQTFDPRSLAGYAVHGVQWTVAGVCFVATLVFLILALARLLCFFSNKVIITPRRVIQQDVLSGSLFSLNIAAVESVRAYTGLLGSLLGYGKVILVTGSGQKIIIANLRRPHEFERELFAAK